MAAMTRLKESETSTSLPSENRRIGDCPRIQGGTPTDDTAYHGTALPPGLPMRPLKFPHETDERNDPILRKGVVNRRPHAADRPMSLESVQTRSRCALHKFALQVLGRHPKRHVHQRPAVSLSGASIESGAIDLRVELRGLALVDGRDCRKTSLRAQPLHHEAQDVNGK